MNNCKSQGHHAQDAQTTALMYNHGNIFKYPKLYPLMLMLNGCCIQADIETYNHIILFSNTQPSVTRMAPYRGLGFQMLELCTPSPSCERARASQSASLYSRRLVPPARLTSVSSLHSTLV